MLVRSWIGSAGAPSAHELPGGVLRSQASSGSTISWRAVSRFQEH
jgi:hypothetical protein